LPVLGASLALLPEAIAVIRMAVHEYVVRFPVSQHFNAKALNA
jgi:hypothetical protein